MEIKKIKVKYCGEEKEIVVNLRKSFLLSKYRLKIQSANDIAQLDKETIEELQKISVTKKADIDALSEKAIAYLIGTTKNIFKVLEYEDLTDIVKIIFEVSEEEAIQIIEEKYNEVGFEAIVNETIGLVETVFTNVKDTSKKK